MTSEQEQRNYLRAVVEMVGVVFVGCTVTAIVASFFSVVLAVAMGMMVICLGVAQVPTLDKVLEDRLEKEKE